MCAGFTRFEGTSDSAAELVKASADDPQEAFPGNGRMKPEQLEIAQLKCEVSQAKGHPKAAAYFAREST